MLPKVKPLCKYVTLRYRVTTLQLIFKLITMGLHDKRISDINERSRSRIEVQLPFTVAMEVRDHNIKVDNDIKKRRITKCPKDCKYQKGEQYISDICLFCYNTSKYKKYK